MSTEKDCFGFYMGNPVCNQCSARQRCKAVLISNGFDIIAASVDALVLQLPDNAAYFDTDRVPSLVDQLMFPPADTHQDEIDDEDNLLGLLEKEELSAKDTVEFQPGTINVSLHTGDAALIPHKS